MPEIVRSIDGNIIGSVENGVFTKRVQGSTHMLKTPPAWAIDCKAFLEQVFFHAHTIRIVEKKSKAIYEISTKTFNNRKVYFDRGFGPQYFVPLKYWHEIREGQTVLF